MPGESHRIIFRGEKPGPAVYHFEGKVEMIGGDNGKPGCLRFQQDDRRGLVIAVRRMATGVDKHVETGKEISHPVVLYKVFKNNPIIQTQ